MKKGNWWFKLDYSAWLTDEDLSRCSLETQGLWMRCICLMHKSAQPELSGTLEQMARSLGCFPDELMRCLLDLKRNDAADVTLGNGTVTVMSRRLKREVSDREKTRLRVQKHRGNDDVTVQSKSKSYIQEETQEGDGGERLKDGLALSPLSANGKIQRSMTPVNGGADAKLHEWMDAVAVEIGAGSRQTIADYRGWELACMKAITEKRELPQLLAVLRSEQKRTKDTPEFFSPTQVLKKLQMQSAKPKTEKFYH